MMSTCPHLNEVEAWARRGSLASLPSALNEHAETCEYCGELISEILETRELASSLPIHQIPQDRRDAMRFELQAAARGRSKGPVVDHASRGPRRRAYMMMAIAAAIGALLFGLVLLTQTSENTEGGSPGPIARIRLEPDAVGDSMTPGPDEVFRLVRGVASFEVRPLEDGERFRVLAGDGVVEVRGTSFTVEVREGRLVQVDVSEGHVLVDVEERRVASLVAGGSWSRPEETVVAAVSDPVEEELGELEPIAAPAPLGVVPPVVRPRRAVMRPARRPALAPEIPQSAPVEPAEPTASELPAVAEPSPEAAAVEEVEPSPTAPAAALAPASPELGDHDEAFSRAWRMLRTGRALEAARAFDALWARSNLDPARRADVLYWAAESHRQAGDLLAAESRAAMLLRNDPTAWRAPEANLIMGEAAQRRGNLTAARRAFERAAETGSPRVSRHARRALELLDELSGTSP